MLFNLLQRCGVDTKVIDDSAVINKKYIECVDSLNIHVYDAFIISVSNKDAIARIEKKLLDIGVPIEKIKLFSYDFYIPKDAVNLYVEANNIDFGDFLKNDTRNLDKLKFKLTEMKNFYYQSRNLETSNKNIFQRVYNDFESKGIMYPYFFAGKAGAESEFGFRATINIEDILASGKRVICFVGNCVGFGGDFTIEQTITSHMDKYLKRIDDNFIVLNCSVNGSTLGEQMSYYIWILRLLKPELVISFFGYELASAYTSCERMLSKYNFIYHTFVEKINKDYVCSDIPLYGETFRRNSLVDDESVIEAITYRMNQFRQIVNGDGVKFLSVLQPFFCKKILQTDVEIAAFEVLKTTIDQEMWVFLGKYFENVIDKFSDIQKENNTFLNLNDDFALVHDNMFRGWLALTADGNELAGKLIAKKVEYVMFGK